MLRNQDRGARIAVGGDELDRARQVVKIGFLILIVVVVAWSVMVGLLSEPRWAVFVDVVWKVLVLLLLSDISSKLRKHNESNR